MSRNGSDIVGNVDLDLEMYEIGFICISIINGFSSSNSSTDSSMSSVSFLLYLIEIVTNPNPFSKNFLLQKYFIRELIFAKMNELHT